MKKLAADDLPGITPAKVTTLGELRAAYLAAQDNQSGEQAEATRVRGARDARLQAITDRRIQIQYAADAEWAADNKAHAGVRKEFALPINRAFNG